MKATELMVGDWVYCEGQPTPENVTIQTIAEDGVWFNGPNYEGAASYDRIFPIPITPEILEKNGFEEFDGWRILDMDDVEIRWIGTILEISGSHGNMELPNVQCVHELQHVLRLCGIEKEVVL